MKAGEEQEGTPFFPHFILLEISLIFAFIGMMLFLSVIFPAELGRKYDILNPPAYAEPEWYFLAVYQLIKTEGVTTLHTITVITVIVVVLVAIPFVDRSKKLHPRERPMFTSLGIFGVSVAVIMSVWAHLTPGQSVSSVYIFSVVACIALVAALAAGLLRRGGRRRV